MKTLLTAILTLFLLLGFIPSQSIQAEQLFSDVPPSHNNYGDIMYLLENGVIEASEKYGISDIVNREEVAVMVAKAIGLNGTQRETKFRDVPKSNPNSGYIQSAVEAGVINGYEDRTFKPYQKVTRGHMAAFIARAFDLPMGDKSFKDVPTGHTAYIAVNQLAAAGITTGYEDGTFKPGNQLTRGHISAFLARAMFYSSNITPDEKALNLIANSPEFDGEVSDLYLYELLDGAYEVRWAVDFGSGIPSTLNSWIIYDGVIIDQLWYGDIFNEYYWDHPYFNSLNEDYVFYLDLYLIAQDGTYIGKLTTNEFDTESIYNEFGQYGSQFAADSIWNQFGTYGSQFSSYSAFSPYSTTPPAIIHGDDIVGYVSTNLNFPGAIHPDDLYSLLLDIGY